MVEDNCPKEWCTFVKELPDKHLHDRKFYIIVRRGQVNRWGFTTQEFWWEVISHVRKDIFSILKVASKNYCMKKAHVEIYEFDFKNAIKIYDGRTP
jgi:hypothetical protein